METYDPVNGAVRQIMIFLFFSRHLERFTHTNTSEKKTPVEGDRREHFFYSEQLALDKNLTKEWTFRFGMMFIRWQ